eukprot:8389586-Pyramimonas_sp.AAC.1
MQPAIRGCIWRGAAWWLLNRLWKEGSRKGGTWKGGGVSGNMVRNAACEASEGLGPSETYVDNLPRKSGKFLKAIS